MNASRVSWRALATAICFASASGGIESAALPTEQEVKVAFVYQFTRFVEWPSDSKGEPRLVIAVLASDQLWALVERTLAGKVSDLPLAVRRISNPAEALQAHILFVGQTQTDREPAFLEAVGGSSVLTIGDSAGFAERGGMIGFRVIENRVRFDINLEEVSRARLRISSEVLKLARVVRTRDGR